MTPVPDKGKPEARDGEQEQKEEEKEGRGGERRGKVGEIAEGQALGSWYEGLLKVFLGLQGEGYSHLGPFYIGRKEDDFFPPGGYIGHK